MRNLLISIFTVLILVFSFSGKAFAENNSFVTIVNPIRISTYTESYLKSFKAEYAEIKKRDLPATWLVTYDVLKKKDFVSELKKIDSQQELGIFLEVTPELCRKAQVSYNKTDSWHRATSLFLSGYTQSDRKKLIDTLFTKFKETFGYYPVSVGSWWTDAYSLSFMKSKYNITGTLAMSDQYDLDGYALWGTWWSVPYYPSKINAALPAQDSKNKLDLVTFRWAARDPLNGYNNAQNVRKQPSLYSIQDYSTIGLDSNYVEKLTEVFAIQHPQNKFGHLTIGLEADLHSDDYAKYFSDHLDITAVKNTRILTMKNFSLWYRKAFPELSPNHFIYSQDLLGSSQNVIWFQTPRYRVGVIYNHETNQTQIIDLRSYFKNLREPNYLTPNKEYSLSINVPFFLDTVIKPSSVSTLNLGQLKDIEENEIVFEKAAIELLEDRIILPEKTILFEKEYKTSEEGIIVRNFFFTIPFSFKKKFQFLPTTIFSPIPQTTYISQDEYTALTVLKGLEQGNVLVYESSCFKCAFQSKYKPTAATGNKSYVLKYSEKKAISDLSFLLAKDSKTAKKILKDKKITYVYLAKYEDYKENLPYLPQDLGLEKAYSNANAEIWKVK